MFSSNFQVVLPRPKHPFANASVRSSVCRGKKRWNSFYLHTYSFPFLRGNLKVAQCVWMVPLMCGLHLLKKMFIYTAFKRGFAVSQYSLYKSQSQTRYGDKSCQNRIFDHIYYNHHYYLGLACAASFVQQSYTILIPYLKLLAKRL